MVVAISLRRKNWEIFHAAISLNLKAITDTERRCYLRQSYQHEGTMLILVLSERKNFHGIYFISVRRLNVPYYPINKYPLPTRNGECQHALIQTKYVERQFSLPHCSKNSKLAIFLFEHQRKARASMISQSLHRFERYNYYSNPNVRRVFYDLYINRQQKYL